MNDQEAWLVDEDGEKSCIGSYPEKEGRLLLETKVAGRVTYWRGNGLFDEKGLVGFLWKERRRGWIHGYEKRV